VTKPGLALVHPTTTRLGTPTQYLIDRVLSSFLKENVGHLASPPCFLFRKPEVSPATPSWFPFLLLIEIRVRCQDEAPRSEEEEEEEREEEARNRKVSEAVAQALSAPLLAESTLFTVGKHPHPYYSSSPGSSRLYRITLAFPRLPMVGFPDRSRLEDPGKVTMEVSTVELCIPETLEFPAESAAAAEEEKKEAREREQAVMQELSRKGWTSRPGGITSSNNDQGGFEFVVSRGV
jgi:hypothetical protein